jgi:hypothetical protein
MIQSALGGQRSEALYDDSGGNERLAASVPLEISGADWAVVVSSPSVVAFEPNRLLIERGLIGLGVAVLLSLILAAVFGELIGRPIRELDHAGAVGRPRQLADAHRRRRPGEAAGLGIAIRDMADRLITQVRDTDTARTEILRQADRLRELLRRTVRLQEDERRRIAATSTTRSRRSSPGALPGARPQADRERQRQRLPKRQRDGTAMATATGRTATSRPTVRRRAPSPRPRPGWRPSPSC